MGVGIDFYHYFGDEHMRFSIDKLEDDDVIEIGEVIGKFREFLEAMLGYEVDEEVVVKYWGRV